MPNYRRVLENGYSYFITVITHRRNPILVENIELLRASFRYAKTKYTFDIEAIVILPDHFHTILTPRNAAEYPNIVRSIKQYFSRYCDEKYYKHIPQSASRIAKGYKPVWQKRYYEHTIRNEKDYAVRMDYIHYNPVKHHLVSRVKEWEYSSFGQYVKRGYYDQEWGNFSPELNFP